jgi:hypothetical protein
MLFFTCVFFLALIVGTDILYPLQKSWKTADRLWSAATCRRFYGRQQVADQRCRLEGAGLQHLPQKSGQALNSPRTQVRLFLVQVRANKQPTVGGNMLPPMESDNVLAHSKAVAIFLQKYTERG